MKKVLILVGMFFQGCNSQSPIENDILGNWEGQDGSVFVFKADGTFSSSSLPAQLVLLPKDQYVNQRFDGTGKWLLRKGSTNWEVYINFKQVSDKKYKSAFPLLVAGENGLLDNKPPWYLFIWKEEEGEDRYKFTKTNN